MNCDPPISHTTSHPFPYPTLFRSGDPAEVAHGFIAGAGPRHLVMPEAGGDMPPEARHVAEILPPIGEEGHAPFHSLTDLRPNYRPNLRPSFRRGGVHQGAQMGVAGPGEIGLSGNIGADAVIDLHPLFSRQMRGVQRSAHRRVGKDSASTGRSG